MQRFYRVDYRSDKHDDAGTLAQRIERAVCSSGSDNHRLLFYFTDAALRGQRSALEYLVKCYPEFSAYRTTSVVVPGHTSEVITDTQAFVQNPQDPGIAVETLLEVAKGIPRRFSFGSATFAWRNVAALDFRPGAPAADVQAAGMFGRIRGRVGFPGITLTSAWGTPKRTLGVYAVVRLAEQSSDSKKPSLPETTKALLDALGRSKTPDVYSLAEPEHAAQAKAHAERVDGVFRQSRANLYERVGELDLEPLESPASNMIMDESPGPVREPLAQALAPLGYHAARAGSPGMLVFEKDMPDGHTLRISVDRGTWSRHFFGSLEIRTEQWARALSIPLAAGDGPGRVYPQLHARQIHRLCNNLAAVAQAAEQTVYEPVRKALAQADV